MEATELRIGNKFIYDSKIYIVNEIKQSLKDEPYNIVGENKDGMFADFQIEDCTPITLTKDILKKCGLTRMKHYRKTKSGTSAFSWYNSNHIEILAIQRIDHEFVEDEECYLYGGEDSEPWGLWFQMNNASKRIKYLHELQNLHYAIWKELTIK